ncbi:MAG: hypothetical protein PHE18_03210 [Candidatus Omnitrophica bacterium]|nr:hypothetical protein [Candidatus Omnitrophota bacterium]MDD5552864.1 hypothetical protein [Candidatus Omnitrophota bacterium]
MDKDTSIFRQIALGTVPRALGFGDRAPGSPTYGCFDRAYWHYKVTDFACANFQEAAYLLALLYAKVSGTRYQKKEPLYRWAEAAVKFWLSIRNSDGSLNEAYPFERSFCATAFTAAAVTESVLTIGLKYANEFIKSAEWLSGNDNFSVSNQTAAAAVALYNIYTLTGQERFKSASGRKIDHLLKRQDPDGFFPEYGGKDAGYLSLTIWYMHKFYLKSRESPVKDAVAKAVLSLERELNSRGSIDPGKGSRNTQYIYPFPSICLSRKIRDYYLAGLGEEAVITPQWLDDRYCLHLLINYLEAGLEEGQEC